MQQETKISKSHNVSIFIHLDLYQNVNTSEQY